MKISNNTKGKINIKRDGINLSLFPGESTNLNRIQLTKVRNLVDYFGLTIGEGKDVTPQFRTPAPKRTIQQLETIVDEKPKKEKLVTERTELQAEETKVIEQLESTPEIKSESLGLESTPEIESMKEEYNDKTAAELRALCKESGLAVSGNRNVLIDRLVRYFTE